MECCGRSAHQHTACSYPLSIKLPKSTTRRGTSVRMPPGGALRPVLRPPATTRIPPVHSPIYHPIVRSQSSRAKAPPPPERNPISMSFRVSSHRAPIRSPEIQDLCFSEGPEIMGAKVATSDRKTHGQNSRSSYSSLVRPGRKSMSELRMSKDCWSHRILFGGPNNSRHMYAATEYHPNG